MYLTTSPDTHQSNPPQNPAPNPETAIHKPPHPNNLDPKPFLKARCGYPKLESFMKHECPKELDPKNKAHRLTAESLWLKPMWEADRLQWERANKEGTREAWKWYKGMSESVVGSDGVERVYTRMDT